MLDDKHKYVSTHNFGKLELVDKDIFFISFNRRDNQRKLLRNSCKILKTPRKSRPNNIKNATININKIFSANLTSFHAINTIIIPINNITHKGKLPNISSINIHKN